MGTGRLARAACSAALMAFALAGLPAAQGQVFRTGVDLVVVEAQVTSGNERPVLDLREADFTIEIDGRPRRVGSLALVNFADQVTGPAGPAPLLPDFDPRVRVAAGRHFVVAVDQGSFSASRMLEAKADVRAFLGRLQPSDRIDVILLSDGGGTLSSSRDREDARRVLDGAVGLYQPPPGRYMLTPSEIVDIAAGDRETLARVVQRECGGEFSTCRLDIIRQASGAAAYLEMTGQVRLRAFSELLRALSAVPGHKELVLVSAGLVTSSRSGTRVNLWTAASGIDRDVADANVTVYVLQLDNSFFNTFGATPSGSKRPGLLVLSQMDDGNVTAAGLELVADEAGGAFLRVRGVAAEWAFDRILAAASAYYLVGVQTEAADRDGRKHAVRLKVNRRGTTVRHRQWLTIPR